jgi:uncharacterized protein (DUF1778 family)
MVHESKEYLTIRVDAKFKQALLEAARIEHRPLSNFSRLLLEYAFEQYQQAGSVRDLLIPQREVSTRRR